MIAMINKSVARTAVILLLVSLVVIEVEVADANPYWIYKTIDPLPGATPPMIKIFSPQNNTVYYSDNVTVDFKVFRPEMGNSEQNTYSVYKPSIYGIKCLLDNVTVQDKTDFNTTTMTETDITLTSPSLPAGNHSLTVTADGVVLIHSSDPSKFWISSSSTVFFAVSPQTLKPIPSSSELILAVAVVVCACLVLGLLLKRKLVAKR